MTLGEYRVGITFNPSASSDVDKLKRAAADLIDLCMKVRTDRMAGGPLDRDTPAFEVDRLMSDAMRCFEEGAMWAVKAATKGPM